MLSLDHNICFKFKNAVLSHIWYFLNSTRHRYDFLQSGKLIYDVSFLIVNQIKRIFACTSIFILLIIRSKLEMCPWDMDTPTFPL